MYSRICYHSRSERINDQFIKCFDCGQSFVKPKNEIKNKRCSDFSVEDTQFNRNYERNFTNNIEAPIEYGPAPIEYYTDKNNQNKIIIDRKNNFESDPQKYRVIINNKECILTEDKIQTLIRDTKVRRIR